MGTCPDPIDISFKVRPFAEVDVHAARPAKHGEKIGIGDGELVACQVLFAGKLLVEPIEALAKILFETSLKASGVVGRKSGPNVL